MIQYHFVLYNEKNYQKSDQIRDELKSLGVEIEDTPDGTIWRKS